jgi:hypothetical protein
MITGRLPAAFAAGSTIRSRWSFRESFVAYSNVVFSTLVAGPLPLAGLSWSLSFSLPL